MSGWTSTASRFHDELKRAMIPYHGKQLTTAEMSNILKSLPGMAQNARLFSLPIIAGTLRILGHVPVRTRTRRFLKNCKGVCFM